MDLSKNHYRKFLVDEVMRSSKATISDAYYEVTEFSKTKEFEDSYKKWIILSRKNMKKVFRPKSMKEIIHGMEMEC